MNLPDFLKFNRESFNTKIFYLFTALLLTAYIFFSVAFIYYQSKTIKRDIIHQGELLTALLARSSKIGVFSENRKLLTAPVNSILDHKELISIQIFTADGTLLISNNKGSGAERLKNNELLDRKAVETVSSSRTALYTENDSTITFWAPVFSGTAYVGHDTVTLISPEHNSPFNGTTSPASEQTSEKNIIGYVKIVLTTTALNNEIRGVVRQSIMLPIFFLIPVWIVVFLFVKGITSPLNLLTQRVTALGTGGPVKKVPVDTDDEIGKLANAFNNMVDSLEAKENEKNQIEEQLRQSQKIEAVGTLAGGVAHDFNNILNIIIGYGSLLKKKATFKENEKKYIDNLIATAEKASSITQSLLSFSRQDTVNLRPAKINSIVSSMENVISRFIGENIELNIILSENDPTILTDPCLIEQILINLTSNAKDAMPDGGNISIRTDSLITEKMLNVTSGRIPPGNYAVITIEDTGTGMDNLTKEKIFDPFFTTKDVGKGTGLGLSMMYGIVQQHNGHIDVVSSRGMGTSFSIYLRTTDLPLSSNEDLEVPEELNGTETILVAEDNDELRLLTEEILKEYGYRIITASDGEDAVNKFTTNSDSIDLLLLDIIMPKKHGKAVFDDARKLRPDIKALFISAYSADRIRSENTFTEISKVLFLQKPFQPARLLRTVRDIIDNRSF